MKVYLDADERYPVFYANVNPDDLPEWHALTTEIPDAEFADLARVSAAWEVWQKRLRAIWENAVADLPGRN